MSTVPQHLNLKLRTVEDLARFVRTRAGTMPNYTLLLGSGCSISSGIRSARQLVDEWLREVFATHSPPSADPYEPSKARAYLRANHSSWYDDQREYASLFEKKFDLPRQRRLFIESEVADKLPSLGYVYLIRLIEEHFFNCVFTTNYDDLLNEAFHLFSTARPVVCAHDSSVQSIALVSPRCKVVKLHGDYLFDDIKSTRNETESLSTNIKAKLAELAGDYGLVVVGYSGCDRSVMEVLHTLVRNESCLKNGIYWCVRKGDVISDEACKLITRDRAYVVEIDGFDELMATLYNNCVGSQLPISSGLISARPHEIIERYLQNEYLTGSPSPILGDHIARLRKEVDHDHFVEAFRSMSASLQRTTGDSFLQKEWMKLWTIRQQSVARNYGKALTIIRDCISESASTEFHVALLDERLAIEVAQGSNEEAIRTCRELQERDPFAVDPVINEAKFTLSLEERTRLLTKAYEMNPNSCDVLDALVEALMDALDRSPIDPAQRVKEVRQHLEHSLRLWPSGDNPAWMTYLDFIIDTDLYGQESPKDAAKELVDEAIKQNPSALVTLRMESHILAAWFKEDEKRTAELLERVESQRLKQSLARQKRFDLTALEICIGLGDESRFAKLAEKIEQDVRSMEDADYLGVLQRGYLNLIGNIDRAIEYCLKACHRSPGPKTIRRLVDALCIADRPHDASDILRKYDDRLSLHERLDIEEMVLDANRDYVRVLESIRRRKAMSRLTEASIVEESFVLLKLKRYEDAVKLLRPRLDACAFSVRLGVEIINFELAKRGKGEKIDRSRLEKLVETAQSPEVRGCAAYMCGDRERAKQFLEQAIQRDKSMRFRMVRWVIFENEVDRRWLASMLDELLTRGASTVAA